LGLLHAVNSTYLEKQSTFIYILYYFFKHTSSWAVYYITKHKDSSVRVLYLSGKKWIYLFIFFITSSYTQQFEPNDTTLRRSYPLVPDSLAKAFWNPASNSPIYDLFSDVKIVHVVSMTPHPQKFFVR
jgi:hypothetical protein